MRKFPIFVDMENKTVLVVGGGNVAQRRINTLLQFGCNVIAVAPKFNGEVDKKGLNVIRREFIESDIDGKFLVVSATDNRMVNHRVAELAKKAGIPVSVADCSEECTFFFPAVALGEKLTAGIVSDGTDHSAVRRFAERIREIIQ